MNANLRQQLELWHAEALPRVFRAYILANHDPAAVENRCNWPQSER
jgi:hypothetical protein